MISPDLTNGNAVTLIDTGVQGGSHSCGVTVAPAVPRLSAPQLRPTNGLACIASARSEADNMLSAPCNSPMHLLRSAPVAMKYRTLMSRSDLSRSVSIRCYCKA
jgi:hypothetical protein